MRTTYTDLNQRAIANAAADSVVPVATILAVMYAVLSVTHPFVLAGPDRWLMVPVAGLSAILCAVVGIAWHRSRISFNAHKAIAILASVVAINTIVHFALYPEPKNTTNFIALTLGMSLTVLSRAWFFTFAGIALAAWLALVQFHKIEELANWDWFYFFGLFVGLVAHEQRLHATRAVARREGILADRDRIMQELLRAPELIERRIDNMYTRICSTASQELAIQSTTIWLYDDELSSLHHVDPHHGEPAEFPAEPYKSLLHDIEQFGVVSNPSDTPFNDPGIMASAIMVSGHMVGIMAFRDQQEARNWSAEDTTFASSVAAVAALAYQTNQHSQLEERSARAERLESLGILAGGVAHDFNNLLTVILGHTELMQLSAPQGEPDTQESLASIMQAGTRAQALAQQMLAYAGRASFVTSNIDLRELAEELAQRWGIDLLPGGNLVLVPPKETVFPVNVDATQIRQVLMNLLTNAADAGATEVRLTIGSEKVTGNPPDAAMTEPLTPGLYNWIELADNGEGMDEATRKRIFDPFYSTRQRGSGLGLAAVLGILRAHDGCISVSSAPGAGSTFRILLPASSERISKPTETDHPVESPLSDTRVLLIEDEALVRELTKQLLGETGRSLTAMSGAEEFAAQLPDLDLQEYELALIDLTLGDGRGTDIATQLRKLQPDLPVIIMSGYDADDALSDFALRDSVAFLQKPFQQQHLLEALRRCKDCHPG